MGPMKRCTNCELPKSSDEFSPGQGRCRLCRNRARRGQTLTEDQKQHQKEIMEKRVAEIITWMEWLKALLPCALCGKHKAKMDWDHLPNTEKLAAVSTLAWQGRLREVICEMQKCQLVCRSCHTKLSHQRGQTNQWGRGPATD